LVGLASYLQGVLPNRPSAQPEFCARPDLAHDRRVRLGRGVADQGVCPRGGRPRICVL